VGVAVTQFVGKSGADGISVAIKRVCVIDRKYHSKMLTAIALTQAAGLITLSEASQATTLLGAISAYCTIFEKVAGNSGFTPA
jgi:hypothetical protein